MEPVDSTVHVYMGNPALVSLCVSKPTSFISSVFWLFGIFSSLHHLDVPQPSQPLSAKGAARIFHWGKAEGREWERLLGRGSKPLPTSWGPGRATWAPSGVWGGAPTARRFSTIFSTQDGLDPDTIMLLMWTVMQPLGGGTPPRASPPPLVLAWSAVTVALSYGMDCTLCITDNVCVTEIHVCHLL